MHILAKKKINLGGMIIMENTIDYSYKVDCKENYDAYCYGNLARTGILSPKECWHLCIVKIG